MGINFKFSYRYVKLKANFKRTWFLRSGHFVSQCMNDCMFGITEC